MGVSHWLRSFGGRSSAAPKLDDKASLAASPGTRIRSTCLASEKGRDRSRAPRLLVARTKGGKNVAACAGGWSARGGLHSGATGASPPIPLRVGATTAPPREPPPLLQLVRFTAVLGARLCYFSESSTLFHGISAYGSRVPQEAESNDFWRENRPPIGRRPHRPTHIASCIYPLN
jgi:hypothetical protein